MMLYCAYTHYFYVHSALEDSIYKSVREEKLWKDVLGKEVETVFVVYFWNQSDIVNYYNVSGAVRIP